MLPPSLIHVGFRVHSYFWNYIKYRICDETSLRVKYEEV